MIDFRYLVITIVAIFLALGIGIMMGSGFVGDFVLRDLEANVDEVRELNRDLNSQIGDLRSRIAADEDFATAVQPLLIDGKLAGSKLVIIRVDGTEGQVLESVEEAVEVSDAEIAATVTLTSKFELGNGPDIAELSEIVQGGAEEDPPRLREAAGLLLGQRAAAVAAGPVGGNAPPGSDVDLLENFIGELQSAGFVDVERDSDQRIIPPRARFLIVGGHRDDAPYPVTEVTTPLASALAAAGRNVVVATEALSSRWDIVASVRGVASEEVSTVDDMETFEGRVSLVYALDRGLAAPPDHYGRKDGADLPSPLHTPSG